MVIPARGVAGLLIGAGAAAYGAWTAAGMAWSPQFLSGAGAGAGLIVAAALGILWWRQRHRAATLAALRRALRRDELDVVYQPIYDLKGTRCVGAEALLRWNRPGHGRVMPNDFIPLAEQSGLIVPMTRWLMRRTAEDLGHLLRTPGAFHLGINLAAAHFRDTRIIEDAEAIYGAAGVPLCNLVFEATEREFIHDVEMAQTVLAGLKDKGAAVALDDFGTGQNGLVNLQRFPVDIVKLDRAFVAEVCDEKLGAPVLEAIIGLGHRLGLFLLAEGVETAVQARFIQARGVAWAQGWHLGHPTTVQGLLDHLSPVPPAPVLDAESA